jgi:hypothetical protein
MEPARASVCVGLQHSIHVPTTEMRLRVLEAVSLGKEET